MASPPKLGIFDGDEGILDLWIEWLREEFRQEYDKVQEVVRHARSRYHNSL